MQHSQRGSVGIVLIILAGIVLIGGITYVYTKKSSNKPVEQGIELFNNTVLPAKQLSIGQTEYIAINIEDANPQIVWEDETVVKGNFAPFFSNMDGAKKEGGKLLVIGEAIGKTKIHVISKLKMKSVTVQIEVTDKSTTNKTSKSQTKKLLDIDSCNKLSDNSMCVTDIATAKKDTSVCNHQKTTELRDWCLQLANEEIQDQKVCEMITVRSDRKWFCYKELAITNKNAELCQMASVLNEPLKSGSSRIPTAYELCVMTIAENTQNAALCQQVGENIQKMCMSTIDK